MSLINCPECGKEFSDKAFACPNCGCPSTELNNYTYVKEMPESERPKLSSCLKCGTPIPVDIEECPFCGQQYRTNKAVKKCPLCGSNNISQKKNSNSCIECGYKWSFQSSDTLHLKKRSYKGFFIVVASIVAAMFVYSLFPSSDYDKSIEKTDAVDTAKINEISQPNALDGFLYEVSGDELLLQTYEGDASLLEIFPTYVLDGVTYTTNTQNTFISSGTVNTLILHEGIAEIYRTAFNSSNVKSVFFPRSMNIVYDNTLDYLRPDDGEQIQIYYAGTEEEWNNIFTHYERQKVEDAINKGDAEEIGSSIGGKINELISGEYDSSLFNYHFSASPVDLK